jgi:hypothetical protein
VRILGGADEQLRRRMQTYQESLRVSASSKGAKVRSAAVDVRAAQPGETTS